MESKKRKSKLSQMGYDLGKGSLKEHLNQDWERVCKEIKGVSSFVAKVGFRCAYPILGNLSYDVQTKLEEVVGKEYYDANIATNVSFVTNGFLYSLGMFSLPDAPEEFLTRLGGSVLSGFIVAAFEYNGRLMTRGTHPVCREYNPVCGKYVLYSDPTPVASLPGKIISLPLEAMIGTCDGIRERRRREE